MKRIAIGQIQQETNTFNPRVTKRGAFENYGWAEGEDVVRSYCKTDELSGFMDLAGELGEPFEWLGLVRAKELAGGPIDDQLVAELVAIMQSALRRTPVDGVLLSLHGSLTSPTIPDVDGHLLGKVRDVIGPDIPLVATLDLHANVTRKMIQIADVLVGYHTFPHIDQVECGHRAARVLADLLTNGVKINTSAVKIPMIVNAKGFTTTGELMSGLYQRLVDAERAPGVLSAGLYMAQPWLDVPELGWTLYQAYRGKTPPLDAKAVRTECWEKRIFNAHGLPGPEEMIAQALRTPGFPLVVSEGHDATNSGAPGDSTRLLAALIQHEFPNAGALTFCIDPASVARCIKAGKGAQLALQIGGVLDPFSKPLDVTVKVLDLGTINYTHNGHGGHNLPVNMGRAAIVKHGTTTIVLTEGNGLGSSPRLYETAGLDPRQYKLVVAKSPEGFRHDYAPFAAGFLYCGAPGCASENLKDMNFKHADRPLFPLDDIASIGEAKWAWEIEAAK